jgi:hypothetical protein
MKKDKVMKNSVFYRARSKQELEEANFGWNGTNWGRVDTIVTPDFSPARVHKYVREDKEMGNENKDK